MREKTVGSLAPVDAHVSIHIMRHVDGPAQQEPITMLGGCLWHFTQLASDPPTQGYPGIEINELCGETRHCKTK